MITKKDRAIAVKRKKKWKSLNFFEIGGKGFIGYFNKNHSLNCGCSICRSNTWFKRYRNRQLRRKHKKIIEEGINELT